TYLSPSPLLEGNRVGLHTPIHSAIRSPSSNLCHECISPPCLCQDIWHHPPQYLQPPSPCNYLGDRLTGCESGRASCCPFLYKAVLQLLRSGREVYIRLEGGPVGPPPCSPVCSGAVRR